MSQTRDCSHLTGKPLDWQASPCTQALLLLFCKRLISHRGLCSQEATVDSLETQNSKSSKCRKSQSSAHWLQACWTNPGKGTEASRCFKRTVSGRAPFTLYEAPRLVPGLTPVVTNLPCNRRDGKGQSALFLRSRTSLAVGPCSHTQAPRTQPCGDMSAVVQTGQAVPMSPHGPTLLIRDSVL